MSLRIGIEADGGAGVGLGHLGRCLALAQALEESGERPVFANVPRDAQGWLEESGGRIASSRGRWDILVADSYRFTSRDLRRLRESSKILLAVDDTGDFAGACDWILNPHLNAHSMRFRAKGGTGFLLGPKFLLMRRDYWKPARARVFGPRARRVLVTLGGSAPLALMSTVVRAVQESLPDALVDVVAGPWTKRAGIGAPGNVRTHRALPTLRPLLEDADICVCAGGQTMYEAIFAGVPSILLELGANQRGNLAGALETGAALVAGAPRGAGFAARLRRGLRTLGSSADLRRKISMNGRGLVDGRGAFRVAAQLFADAKGSER
ncbi:MAG: hypothetical protein HY078_05830 [Elusimicrobia bacterium]|nr:hypothetical protein [Elusimicrobiota bacterium]